jgi:hypothetical protein
MTRADATANFTYREAFNITDRKFVTLADTAMREVEVSVDGRWAVRRDTRGSCLDYRRRPRTSTASILHWRAEAGTQRVS